RSGQPGLLARGANAPTQMHEHPRRRHIEAGYSFVTTPHITKQHLFERSGPLGFSKDGMFPPMHVDAEYDEEGNETKPGQDYYLKPMNCPMHNLIFDTRGRS